VRILDGEFSDLIGDEFGVVVAVNAHRRRSWHAAGEVTVIVVGSRCPLETRTCRTAPHRMWSKFDAQMDAVLAVGRRRRRRG
jgi:hypothetical protein